MKWIYNKVFILENPILFYSFIILMIVMIAISFFFVYKELNKKDDNK